MLNNAKKHAAQRGRKLARAWIDPMSTARGFFEFGRGLQAARTWLLRVGWQRWGPVQPSSLPVGAG